MSKKKVSKIKTVYTTVIRWPAIAALLMAVVAGIAYFIDIKAGIVATIAFVAFVIAFVVFMLTSRERFTRAMVDFATGYAHMQKELLDGFVVPYGMLDESGRILWMNNAMAGLIGNEKKRTNVEDIFPEYKKNAVLTDSVKEISVSYAGRDYRMMIDPLHFEGNAIDASMVIADSESAELYAIYLFDETEINTCKKELHNERFVCGLIYIDNYDEALESIDEVRRSLLIALVERKINKYISAGDGVVKKLEKDKYLVCVRYRFFEQMVESRFQILEEVKSVNIGNAIAVTISIGIGAMQASFAANYEMARAAIDLALGRGGDQAVIREGSKVTYFGGKTSAAEKNTRVKARVKAHALRELLEATDNVLIMGHKISDVDAVGSAVGIYAAAKVFDKKAHIVLNTITTSLQPIVDTFKNNDDYPEDMFLTGDEALAQVDNNTLLVVVDVNKKSYTECPELIGKCKTTVVLDHHRQGDDPIDTATLSYIEPYASSACEMVAEVLQYITENIRLKNVEADAIYAGIVIDTNNFTNKAGARTFDAAAFVRRSGADIIRVRKLLRSSMAEYKAKAEAVRHAEVYRDCFAISTCPSSGLTSPTIVGAQAANELLNISGIKASFVLTFYEDEIYISARSIDEINVQLIMEKLGGGGHMTIAGAQLKDIDMEDALVLVRKTLDEMIEEGAI